jgi:hypothetical protein
MLIVADKPIMLSVDLLNVVAPQYNKEIITTVKCFIVGAPLDDN